MTITFPKIALGIPIPNPTFALPDDGTTSTTQGAAGWDRQDTQISMSAIDGSENYGHPRAQRYTLGGTQTKRVYGQFSPYGLCCAAETVEFRFAISWKGAVAGSWRIEHVSYNAAGTALTTTLLSLANSTTSTTWTLTEFTQSITIPAATSYHGINIILASTGSTMTRDFRFIGFGLWFDSGGFNISEYTFPTLPDHPGTYARLIGRREVDEDSMGRRRYIGRMRAAHAYEVGFNLTRVDDTFNQELWRAHAWNMGVTYQGSSNANPGGGQFPLLVIPNYSGMPQALYADFADDVYPMQPATDVYWDPPYWAGQLTLLERL